ncbi:ribosomal protein S18-alanine N-acetyltransferase [Sphingomonas sp. Mn802worker]|uniref:ribosomal protein S18-alanine N-acetyltransferase n=1 Tax=Sphingomonas sp. Mn802worker TaxID=629773 RepID=UPI00037ABC9D|nr:ribosomal protein S18-alanine N-acetyltransferase [Sphingomonas sp. Mn802worker]
MSTQLRMVELANGRVSDADAVDRVMQAAFDPRYGEAWTRAQCVGILTMPGVWLTLAKAEGEVVGFALVRAIIDEAELLLIAVDPAHRRRGVAGALMRSLLAECRGRGVKRIHLEVRANNAALALYTGAGFTKAGERRDYYRAKSGEAFDAHTYARDL